MMRLRFREEEEDVLAVEREEEEEEHSCRRHSSSRRQQQSIVEVGKGIQPLPVIPIRQDLISDALQCSICLQIVSKKPSITPCDHMFCYDCIESAFEQMMSRRRSNSTTTTTSTTTTSLCFCPNCLHPCPNGINDIQELQSGSLLYRIWSDIQVKCSNHYDDENNTCSWTGSIVDLYDHHNSCCQTNNNQRSKQQQQQQSQIELKAEEEQEEKQEEQETNNNNNKKFDLLEIIKRMRLIELNENHNNDTNEDNNNNNNNSKENLHHQKTSSKTSKKQLSDKLKIVCKNNLSLKTHIIELSDNIEMLESIKWGIQQHGHALIEENKTLQKNYQKKINELKETNNKLIKKNQRLVHTTEDLQWQITKLNDDIESLQSLRWGMKQHGHIVIEENKTIKNDFRKKLNKLNEKNIELLKKNRTLFKNNKNHQCHITKLINDINMLEKENSNLKQKINTIMTTTTTSDDDITIKRKNY